MSQETKLGSNLAGYPIRVLTLAVAAMIFGLAFGRKTGRSRTSCRGSTPTWNKSERLEYAGIGVAL